jgi:2-iminobutanoate/2-iminopropanoate deaminase
MKLERISSPDAPKAIGSYSPAISAGNLVFCSGQLGMDPVSGELAVGFRAQADRALLNLKATLAAAGLGLGDVAKTTIFLSNIADYAVINEVYASHFKAPYPARSTIQAAALPRGALVEIDALAVRE